MRDEGGRRFPFYSNVGLHEENLEKARSWIAKADLILVIGANGSYGNAYFGYRKHGAKIIQINPGKQILIHMPQSISARAQTRFFAW